MCAQVEAVEEHGDYCVRRPSGVYSLQRQRRNSGPASGTTINLSVGGALITVKEPPVQKGRQLSSKFKVVVGGNDVFPELGALIRTVTADSADTLCRLDLECVNDSARNSIALQAYIDRHLLVQSLGA